MAKKVTKKSKTTKKKTKKKGKVYTNIGRPKGAKTYVPRGLEVRSTTTLSRSNAINKRKGIRRLVVETIDEEHAQRLERLAALIRKRDKALMKLTEPKGKRKSA